MSGERKRWLDEPKNVWKVVFALFALCAILIGLDFVVEKHTHFLFEEWWGFYAVYGFVACVLLVLAAKVLRFFVKRGEDYYDE